jgi:hypothetical protein
VSAVREATDKHKLWFRGHSKSEYKLVPTIGRLACYGGLSKTFNAVTERELLHRFRRRAFPHDGRVDQAGYALFLARHHGFPTRLLDWTANVLYALYFACMENVDHDGHVWAFRQRGYAHVLDAFDLVGKDEAKLLSSKPFQVKIVHPVFNSARLIAQEGGFTLHSDPWRPLEDLVRVRFGKESLDIEHLYRWTVPKVAKPTLLRELSGLGISHRNVFPELDGIARSLWETEVLWNPDRGRPDNGLQPAAAGKNMRTPRLKPRR